MIPFNELLKQSFGAELVQNIPDYWTSGGEWATPCMCGHDSHGYNGHCTHMTCDTDDCECGGYEPQPGMALPTVRHDGPHPLLRLCGGSR